MRTINNIFERIIDIECNINDLIFDIETQCEDCPNNETEILQALISANSQISKVYKLNKKNFADQE